jgi:hypothetical protein
MTGGKREGKGRDSKDPSLSVFPLYKGVSEDLGRDWAKMSSSPFFYEKLLSRHSKIGGTFIKMPSKGVGDAFHDSKGCLVTE